MKIINISMLLWITIFTSCKQSPEVAEEKLSQEVVDLRGQSISKFPEALLKNDACRQIFIGSKTFKKYPPNTLVPNEPIKLLTIPEEIGKLNNLRKLSITASDLSVLPKSLSQLRNLKTLDISFNSKLDTASFVAHIGNIPRLDTLIMYRTFIPFTYREKLWVSKPHLIIIDEFSNPDYTGLSISN
ncbi:MAG TPA: hypothetical protein PLZ32_18755 [Saprospiraceae bacterium]|nr:hypothetical protein [Saprospiraceae bacterium]